MTEMARPTASEEIGTRACPDCPMCGTVGETLYAALHDRLFGAPGEWRMARCPNPECGLLWLDPMPLPEEVGKAYRSYYTHETVPPSTGWKRLAFAWSREGYLSMRHGYPLQGPSLPKRTLGALAALWPEFREYLDHRVMHLRARPGARLLDVGCGSGRFIRLMQEIGWRAEGLDFDPGAVEAARRQGLTVWQGALEAQGFAAGSFEAVTMSHLIEHVPDPAGLLRECHRILAPGGQLTIATPNAASWGHARFRESWRGLEPPRHLHVFTPRPLRAALERAGFTRCTVRTSVQLARMIYRESMALREGRGRGGSRPAPAGAFWFSLREMARRLTEPECGEEVVVVAHR